MILRVSELDGSIELEADLEGIDFLLEGLELLKDLEVGRMKSSPTLVECGGEPVGAGEFVLKRA